MNNQKVVILFTRLSDYMLNVFDHWVRTSDIELHIIRQEVDLKEAPFKFKNEYPNIYFYNRSNLTPSTLLDEVRRINPKMILCSGWSDKEYLKTVSYFRGKIPTVMAMDNQFTGTIKQKAFSLINPKYLKKKFSHVWVPGNLQEIYAKKLGFTDSQIHKGFYVANNKNFSASFVHHKNKPAKKFFFVGRYIDVKGIEDLWKAFIELQEETPNDWELLCIGAGPLFNQKIEHPKIKHLGFVQPNEFKKLVSKGGVFVLPSHFEPWGVVVHEFALLGFPILSSDVVGAANHFVQEGKNGYIFKHANVQDLKLKLQLIISKSDEDLIRLGKKSIENSHFATKEKWVNTANNLLASKV